MADSKRNRILPAIGVFFLSTLGTFIGGGLLIGLIGTLTHSEPYGICSGSGPAAGIMTAMIYGLFPFSPIAGWVIALSYYEGKPKKPNGTSTDVQT